MPSNGERLAAWRKLEKLSQLQAAERFSEFVGWDVAQGVWSTWETGRRVPGREYAALIETFTDEKIRARDWPSKRRPRRTVASAAE